MCMLPRYNVVVYIKPNELLHTENIQEPVLAQIVVCDVVVVIWIVLIFSANPSLFDQHPRHQWREISFRKMTMELGMASYRIELSYCIVCSIHIEHTDRSIIPPLPHTGSAQSQSVAVLLVLVLRFIWHKHLKLHQHAYRMSPDMHMNGSVCMFEWAGIWM